MSYFGSTEWFQKVAAGQVSGHSLVHKFGYGTIGTSFQPITFSGFYRTPTSATALEVLSDDNDDGLGGSGGGARQVTIMGLNSSWEEVTQTITLDGTNAVALTTNLVRLYRWYVSSSGNYADQTSGSHTGTLTIRESGGGAIWSQIDSTDFPLGQSLIGAYTIPSGKTGYIFGYNVKADANKSVDIIFFSREAANDTSDPYSGIMRAKEYLVGIEAGINVSSKVPIVSNLTGPCDIGFLAKISTGTAEIAVDFDVLLVDE